MRRRQLPIADMGPAGSLSVPRSNANVLTVYLRAQIHMSLQYHCDLHGASARFGSVGCSDMRIDRKTHHLNQAPVVMAVDHEPRVLRLIRHELSGRGFRVVTAHRGTEALKAAETERPDIMLVDVATPDLPGEEVVRRLRERTSAPIIILT